MAVNQLIKSAMQAVEAGLPSPRYAYAAPLYKQAKAIAWDYVKHFARPIPGAHFNESDLRVDLPGDARITLLGADNPDAIRGIYLDGVVLDEYAYMNPEMWTAVVRPALVDRKGYVLFLGTPFGRNHFHKLYQTAQQNTNVLTMLYRASETNVVPADELAAARADMDADLYAQEFECSFEAAIRGAYYARQLEKARADGRIKPLLWEPQAPVDTWWDLGWSDATAIIFTQTIGREIRVLDYYEASHSTATDLAKHLATKPYLYGKHHLPHDAGHATQGGQGLSMQTQLNRLGVRPSVVLGQNEILHGINQARNLFSRCWFDSVKCERLLDALGTYRQEWDVKRQDFKADPYHDWSSHGADAFRYLAIGHRDHTDGLGRPRAPMQRTYDTTYDPIQRVGVQRSARTGGTAWRIPS